MMSGELTHTTGFADTSGPVPLPTFTDLQLIQAEEYESLFQQEAASYMTEFNMNIDAFLYPEGHQPEAWNQGEVRRRQFSISIK